MHDVHAAFFPNSSEVTPDYWEYVKWRGCHRLFSSMSSIFATQSLLLAVGVGAKRALPAAATINWVLKDGLGRLGRLTVATRFGESFDSDLKRFRFATSLLYASSLALDYLTPLFPGHFLPMAALANIGKSVGLTTYISTQPAFHRSFARSENLADVSAKAQAQQMAVDTMGLTLAVTLSALCKGNESARGALPLVAFPFLVTGDLVSIYNELSSIHLRTLNKERAEIIADEWLRGRKKNGVPTPEEVSAKERLILPPDAALGAFPLTIAGLECTLVNEGDVANFLSDQCGGGDLYGRGTQTTDRQKYGQANNNSQRRRRQRQRQRRFIVTIEEPCLPLHGREQRNGTEGLDVVIRTAPMMLGSGGDRDPSSLGSILRRTLLRNPKAQGAVRATLRSDATANDALEVVLQAAYLRQALCDERTMLQRTCVKNVDDCDQTRKELLLDNANEASSKDLASFVRQLDEAGWQISPFMLSSSEKKFYYLSS